MSLIRLIYASTIADGVEVSEIKAIVAKAVKKNSIKELTGFLAASRQYFLQCLEGERDKVNELYQLISTDARHSRVTLVDYQAIEQRQFKDWSMGVVMQLERHQALISKHCETAEFDPYSMQPQACLNLLLDLSAIKRGEKEG